MVVKALLNIGPDVPPTARFMAMMGNAGQKGVRARVYEHRHSYRNEKQHHLQDRRAHYQEHDEYHRDTDDYGLAEAFWKGVDPFGEGKRVFSGLLLQPGEFFVHDGHALLHGVGLRQVARHVGVDVDLGDQEGTRHGDGDSPYKQGHPVPYDPPYEI